MLSSKNYVVVSAGNGEEALDKLRSETFDLIISDILMPVMDGFQLCRECKKDPKLERICFIFCTTTFIDEKDEEFALALGAVRFIRKPLEAEVFLKLIKEVTGESGRKKFAQKKYNKEDDKEVLKLYNEHLIAKLEQRNIDLENEIAAHKETMNRHEGSEEKYRSFIQQSSQGTILANGRGIILNVIWLWSR